MYAPKTSKLESEKKGNYFLYNSTQPFNLNGKYSFTIVSIDPAIKNLAFRIEKRYVQTGWIETVVWDKQNFYNDDDPPQSQLLYLRINQYLDRHHEQIKNADIVVIERQLAINYKSLRVYQHIISYFTFRYPNILCTDIDPHMKGFKLGAPKGISKPALKQWAVEEMYNLLLTRRDQHGLDTIDVWKKKKHKLDDLADSLVQIEALCILWDLPLTRIPTPKPSIKII